MHLSTVSKLHTYTNMVFKMTYSDTDNLGNQLPIALYYISYRTPSYTGDLIQTDDLYGSERQNNRRSCNL